MSEAFGPEFYRDDYRQRLWQHAADRQGQVRRDQPQVAGPDRSLSGRREAATCRSIPPRCPPGPREIEPWMCVALVAVHHLGLARGRSGDDLERIGIKPDPVEYHGSNEWLVAANRTAYDAPIALIDPHLSWYGAFRFYEARLYGGEIEFSGMCHPGQSAAGAGAQPLLFDRHDHRRARHLGRVRRGDQSREPAAISLRRQVARHDRRDRSDRREGRRRGQGEESRDRIHASTARSSPARTARPMSFAFPMPTKSAWPTRPTRWPPPRTWPR